MIGVILVLVVPILKEETVLDSSKGVDLLLATETAWPSWWVEVFGGAGHRLLMDGVKAIHVDFYQRVSGRNRQPLFSMLTFPSPTFCLNFIFFPSFF